LTVAATTRRAGPYAGNGVATTFDFEFKVFASTDIAVVLADEIGTETDLVLNSDYSVSLNADQNADPGGTITYPISGSPMATGEVLAIVGGLAYSQTTQLPNGGAYNASVVERALDRITILVQQILETATRGVQLAVTAATDVSSRLPAPVANFLVAWNPTATALVNVDPAVVQGSQAFASWIVDTFDGTGTVGGEYALTGNAAGIGNIDVSVAGITQRAGIDFTLYNNVVTSVAAWPVGTDNVLFRYGEAVSVADIPVESSMITDSTAVGRAVLTAVGAAAARSALSAAASGANTDTTSMGNNTSTVYTTGGTSTAYTITPNPAITAYAIGQSHMVNFAAASGASPTIQISGIATPPNLVAENGDGTYRNIGLNELPINHRSRVTLISTTQALVERMPQGTTYGTPVAAASQTAMNFTGIPPNAKKVVVILADFGTNGSSAVVLRGGAGSNETAGYVHSNGQAVDGGTSIVSLNPTSGFAFNGNIWSSAIRMNGRIELLSVGSNQWVVSGSLGRSDSGVLCFVAGRKTFSGTLDRLQLTTVGGADLITNGLAQMNYEV